MVTKQGFEPTPRSSKILLQFSQKSVIGKSMLREECLSLELTRR